MTKTPFPLILVVIFIFLAHMVSAQENFQPGYVVSTNGDTLRGYINYLDWDRNPRSIMFKQSPEAGENIATVGQIRSFEVEKERYVSAAVEVETSPYKTQFLTYDAGLHSRKDTAFLRVLVVGEKSLYYYKDPDGKESYYIRENGEYQLLVYKRYLVKDLYNKTVTGENNRYIGQLTLYFQDCPAIRSKINSLNYNRSKLVGIFSRYYNCIEEHPSFEVPKEKVKLEIGALAGASLTKLIFKGEYTREYLYDDFNPSINFSGGVYLGMIIPRTRGKWSFLNEFLYTSYGIEGSYTDYVHEERYTTTEYSLGYSLLTINTVFRFKQPVGKFHLFIDAGMSNSFAFSEANTRKETLVFFQQVRTTEGKALPDTRKYQQGLVVGAGAEYKKFILEFRYDRGNGMSINTNLHSITNKFFLFLGYRFN